MNPKIARDTLKVSRQVMKRLLPENKLAREVVGLGKFGLYQGASDERHLLSGNPANLGRQLLVGS
jgi:hypothetical protein